MFKLEDWNIVIGGLKKKGILFCGNGVINCVLGLYILNKFGLGSICNWNGFFVDGAREFTKLFDKFGLCVDWWCWGWVTICEVYEEWFSKLLWCNFFCKFLIFFIVTIFL